MKKMTFLLSVTLFFLSFQSFSGSIGGKITEVGSGYPISGVKITAVGLMHTYSEMDGSYALINLPAGTINITAEADGYHLYSDFVALHEGESLSYNIVMEEVVLPQCDTLHFPLQGSPTVLQATSGGYICGNNIYGDLAKADYFDPDAFGKLLHFGYFKFAYATSLSGMNPEIEFRVWANNGTGGFPGDILRSSSLPLSVIQNDVDNGIITAVGFDPPVFIDAPFYLGVMLPALVGDTLALYSTSVDDIVPGISYELGADNIWYPFNNLSSWGINIGQAIYAEYCDEGFGYEDHLNPPHISIYPNPVRDILHIRGETGDQFNVRLVNTNGQTVGEWYKQNADGCYLSLNEYPAGMYVVMIYSSQYFASKKILIIK